MAALRFGTGHRIPALTLPSQLAVVLGATSDVFGTCRGQGVRPIHD